MTPQLIATIAVPLFLAALAAFWKLSGTLSTIETKVDADVEATKAVVTKIDKVMGNHLPHLDRRMSRLEVHFGINQPEGDE